MSPLGAFGLEAGLTAVAAAIVFLLLRRHSTSFETAEQRATLRTLAFATSTLRSFRRGLTAASAARVLPEIAAQAGAKAVALYTPRGLLAFHAAAGLAARHRSHAAAAAASICEAMASGRLRLVAAHAGPEPGCEIRHAAVAPISVDGSPVAALVSFHTHTPAPAELRVVSDIAELLGTRLRLRHADREREELARSELRALRAQISPHFIYNALTTIGAFIRTDPERARELVLEFADFSRRIFRRPEVEFTSLADELIVVRQYLQLEQARLGDRLRVRLNIDPEVLNIVVPTLVIQPLVENAIKHGLASAEGSGLITIRAEDEDDECVIAVTDNGAGFDPPDHDGHGALDNINRRLGHVFGDAHRLEIRSAAGQGTTIRLRVPKYRPGVHPS